MSRPNEDLTFAQSGLSSLLLAVLLSCFSNLSPASQYLPCPLQASCFPQGKCIPHKLEFATKNVAYWDAVLSRIETGKSGKIRRPLSSYLYPKLRCIVCCPLRAVRGAFVGTPSLPDILGSLGRVDSCCLGGGEVLPVFLLLFQSASTPWPTQTSRY